MVLRWGLVSIARRCVTRSLGVGVVRRLPLEDTRRWLSGGAEKLVRRVETAPSDKEITRTCLCGHVSDPNEGQIIDLWGWVDSARPAGAQLLFMTLKDYSGRIQIVCEDKDDGEASIVPHLQEVSEESVLWVRGLVRARPGGASNDAQGASGRFEVMVDQVRILNTAPKTLPTDRFSSRSQKERADRDDESAEKERAKLQHRVLFLRTQDMQRALRLRAKAYRQLRESLDSMGFLEVETPTLFKRTSEGAREFIVPSSSNPGKFYALVQSPQQYKQLLMAGGIDRYYQIARCYRDEALRADRQPEFTQLDMELSCTNVNQIYDVMEELLTNVWRSTRGIEVPRPFPQMSYHDALRLYGSDKPDLRFGFEITDVTECALDPNGTSFIRTFQENLASGGRLLALNLKGLGSSITAAELKNLPVYASSLAASGLVTAVVTNKPSEGGYQWKSSLGKALEGAHVMKEKLAAQLEVEPGDLVLLSCEKDLFLSQSVLGKLRLHCAELLQAHKLLTLDPDDFRFLWVTRFPLLSRVEGCSEVLFECSHHPFTAPVAEDIPLLKTHPEQVRGQHYDCVVNGVELGGGSIRIHNAQLQLQIFRDILNLSEEQISHFQHLIEALQVGCPPHGGIAFGLDRMCALLAGTSSIRDVIAFPKSHSGRELLTGTPTTLPKEDLNSYGLHLAPITEL
jgi:aspartyl-tRNA synthetase